MKTGTTPLLLAFPVLVGCAFQTGDGPGLEGRILYSRLTDGTWQIWEHLPASGSQRQITGSAGDKRHPCQAPGGRVLYHTADQGCEIVDPVSGSVSRTIEEFWPVRDIVYSPRGSRIAFCKLRSELADSANIVVRECSSGQVISVTAGPGLQWQPSWSPDETLVAFSGGHGYGSYEIQVVRPDGTEHRVLTQNRHHEFDPAWSPDGGRLAYSSDATVDFEIWVMNADGTDLKQVTRSPERDSNPTWSPDGEWIAFTSTRSQRPEIWITRPDGSDPRALIFETDGACDPAWVPTP